MALTYFSVEEHQEEIPGVAEETPKDAGLQGEPEAVLDIDEKALDVEIHADATENVDDTEAEKVVAEIAKEEAEIEYVRENLERAESIVDEMEDQNRVIVHAVQTAQLDEVAASGFEASRRVAAVGLGLNPEEGIGAELVDRPQLENYVETVKFALEADNLPAVVDNKDSSNGKTLEKIKKWIAEQWKKLMTRLGKVRELLGKLGQWINVKINSIFPRLAKLDDKEVKALLSTAKAVNGENNVVAVEITTTNGSTSELKVTANMISAAGKLVDYKAAIALLDKLTALAQRADKEISTAVKGAKENNDANVYTVVDNIVKEALAIKFTSNVRLKSHADEETLAPVGKVFADRIPGAVSNSSIGKAAETLLKSVSKADLVTALKGSQEFTTKFNKYLDNYKNSGVNTLNALENGEFTFEFYVLDTVKRMNEVVINYANQVVKGSRDLTKLADNVTSLLEKKEQKGDK